MTEIRKRLNNDTSTASGNDGEEKSLDLGSEDLNNITLNKQEQEKNNVEYEQQQQKNAQMNIQRDQKYMNEKESDIGAKLKTIRRPQIAAILGTAYSTALAQAASTNFTGDATKLRGLAGRINSEIYTGSELDEGNLNSFFKFMGASSGQDLKKSYKELNQAVQADPTANLALNDIAKAYGVEVSDIKSAYSYMADSAKESDVQQMFEASTKQRQNIIDVSKIGQNEEQQEDDDEWLPKTLRKYS